MWRRREGNGGCVTQRIGIANFTPSGRVLTALTDAYQIQIWDPSAQNLEKTVIRKYEPIPNPEEEIMAFTEPAREAVIQALPGQLKSIITDSVIRKAVELAEFPPVKNPIFSLVPLPDDGFLVLHDVSFSKHQTRADIFSPEGRFLGTFTLPHLGIAGGTVSPRWIFTEHTATVIDLIDDSENVVTRYTYKRVPR